MQVNHGNEVARVAIALVFHNGCYLVGRRGPDGPLAGYYEFPGGKCHADETPESCAVRECREETGLVIEVVRLRHQKLHTFLYGTVHLHFFDCRLHPSSQLDPLRSGFMWVPLERLAAYNFPEPNGPLIQKLIANGTSSKAT